MAEWRRVLMLERRGIELMPVSGHSALDQVHEYLDEVDQERAAEAAIMKLAMVGTGRNRPLSDPKQATRKLFQSPKFRLKVAGTGPLGSNLVGETNERSYDD
jgi:hypothetical protein